MRDIYIRYMPLFLLLKLNTVRLLMIKGDLQKRVNPFIHSELSLLALQHKKTLFGEILMNKNLNILRITL